MVAGMSRNQQDAEARKRHRERKIAQVQRERDIAEVFGVQTAIDLIMNYAAINRTFGFERTYVNSGLERDFQCLKFDSQMRVTGVEGVVVNSSTQLPATPEYRLQKNQDNDSVDYHLDWMDRGFKTPFWTMFLSCSPRGGIWFDVVGGFYDEEEGSESWYTTHFYIAVDKPNGIVFETWKALLVRENGRWSLSFNTYYDGEYRDDIPDVLLAWFSHAVNTIHVMNTSNIELVDQPPNPRLSAISEREFGRPLTTYKVLKVNTSHKQYQGVMQESGLQDFDPRRMHVVRGHHAEYGTNGRGLHFGKYERKIWIPAHVRGNEELGIVVKDYEVVNHAN